jgi:hypothetical protein
LVWKAILEIVMSRRRVAFLSFIASSLALALPHDSALGQQPQAVVELFTSQGCSSCPPADKVLGELARDPSIVALSLPVDYWDYLGWKDTLASPGYTARQRLYARTRGDRDVYTPQVVVNGMLHVLGSDKEAITRAIAQTRQNAMTIPVQLTRAGEDRLTVSVPEANAGEQSGEVWICGVAKSVPVKIGRGENNGSTITYHNVGRRWLKLGVWDGKAASWTVPVKEISAEGVDAAAVIVQTGNATGPGPMLGAAFTALN